MMVNWKGFGRKRSWPNFKILSQHLPGGTEENYEKPQSGWSVAGADISTQDILNTKQERPP
jgi:hypothetical protein